MNSRLPALFAAILVPVAVIIFVFSLVSGVEATTTWTVGVDPECPTIQECIDHNSVLDGDIIYLPTGVYTEQVSISKELTISGDGPVSTTVTADNLGRVFWVTANAATFQDMAITGGLLSFSSSRGAGIYSSGALTLTNVVVADNIIAAVNGSGAGVYSTGDIYVSDSLFRGNVCSDSSCNGGGLYVASTGETVIMNTDFFSNAATLRGAGVANPFGSVTIIGGRLEDNTTVDTVSQPMGGGVNAGFLVMSGTVLVGNVAKHPTGNVGQGGGAYASSFVITNSTFTENEAGQMGGAIYGSGRITGGWLEENNALSGGAIRTPHPAEPLIISDTTFVKNSETGIYALIDTTIVDSRFDENGSNAVAIGTVLTMTNTIVENTRGLAVEVDDFAYIETSKFISNATAIKSYGFLEIVNSSFLSNTSEHGAAGINSDELLLVNSDLEDNSCTHIGCVGSSIVTFGDTTIVSSTIKGGRSGGGGGGVRTSGYLTITDSLFMDNQCVGDDCWGGAISVFGSLALNKTRLISNVSTGRGGAIWASGISPEIALSNVSFEGNSVQGDANSDGGGALYASGLLRVEQSVFVGNNSTSVGGAIVVNNQNLSNIPVYLVNLLLVDNTADDEGGSLYFEAGSSGEIVHATIAGSSLIPGSAVANRGSIVAMTNSIIVSHEVGIDNQAISSIVSEDYNLFYANQANFSGPVITGSNSLIGDPLFINSTGGDFHLGEESPAIDTGIDMGIPVDLDGNSRPLGSKPDRGAYETSSEFIIFLPLLNKPA